MFALEDDSIGAKYGALRGASCTIGLKHIFFDGASHRKEDFEKPSKGQSHSARFATSRESQNRSDGLSGGFSKSSKVYLLGVYL